MQKPTLSSGSHGVKTGAVSESQLVVPKARSLLTSRADTAQLAKVGGRNLSSNSHLWAGTKAPASDGWYQLSYPWAELLVSTERAGKHSAGHSSVGCWSPLCSVSWGMLSFSVLQSHCLFFYSSGTSITCVLRIHFQAKHRGDFFRKSFYLLLCSLYSLQFCLLAVAEIQCLRAKYQR